MRLFPGMRPEELSRCFLIALRPGSEDRPLPETVLALCDSLKREAGLSPVFLAMHRRADTPILRTLRKRFPGARVLETEPTGSELIGLLSRMSFCLTGRLHALIASVAAGTPCLSITEEEKLTAFAARVSLPCLPPDADAGSLIRTASDLLQRRETVRKALLSSAERLKQSAEEDADALFRILQTQRKKGGIR